MKKTILFIIIGIVVIFVAASVVINGRAHTNPPVIAEPQWDSPQTRELASRACFDCHSNETVWPWYSYFPPASNMVLRDVVEGRRRLNFSEWGTRRFDEPWEISEVIAEGRMPPKVYLPLHPKANLTQAEKQELIRGFQATFNK
ncbi:MAG: heme-binding domain-containing protein [Anaerolineales bacterium]|jgi:hypothetical protein